MEQVILFNGVKVAEIEVVYRSKMKASLRPIIADSNSSYLLLKNSWNQDLIDLQEQFKVLLLDRGNRVLGVYQASSGGVTGTIADPKLILIAALRVGASSIILAHNHPSGNLRPSRADEELTVKIRTAAAFLDIALLDHLILSSESYFSFADEGL